MATNPFNRELTLDEHELNLGGKCLGCNSETEPIVEYDVWEDGDGNTYSSPCLVGWERYCPCCHETMTLIFIEEGLIKPLTQEEIEASNDLPF
jgi:hypothetical protein